MTGDQAAFSAGLSPDHYDGTVVEKWGDKEWLEFGIDQRRWTLSQFLHGEQGALLCTAKIVETVPWYDAKLYAATQVVDEARHVEVFDRYIEEKLGGGFQVNAHLRMLLDDIINDSRWDMTYLGMQVMVEGLALAAFGFLHQMTEEPLLKQMLRYVMSDEARHVAFGVLSLKEVYDGMTDAEMKDRQEFAFEAAVRMRDRFLSQEVWEKHGVNPRDVVPLVLPRPDPRAVPADAVLQDRPQLQEARPARPQRQVAAPPLRGDGRHPVRGLGGHRLGVHQVRARRRGPRRAADPRTSASKRGGRHLKQTERRVSLLALTSQIQVQYRYGLTGTPRSTGSSPPSGRSRSGISSASIATDRRSSARRPRVRRGELTALARRRLGVACHGRHRQLAGDARRRRAARPAGVRFELGDIGAWAPTPRPATEATHDLVLANAALQWVPDHRAVLARWAAALAPAGNSQFRCRPTPISRRTSLAAGWHRRSRSCRRSTVRRLPDPVAANVLVPEAYATLLYDLGFAEQHVRLQVYRHVLDSTAAVVEWVRGTTLTRFFKRLPTELHEPFVDTYRRALLARIGEHAPYFFRSSGSSCGVGADASVLQFADHGHTSDPRFLTMHALRIKGFAKVDVLAELTALAHDDVEATSPRCRTTAARCSARRGGCGS